MKPDRRRLVAAAVGSAAVQAVAATAIATLGAPALASSRRALRQMTDGPFYPPARWRARWRDWDADLTRVEDGREMHIARGEHLGLTLIVVDTNGRLVDDAEVEIWQCDALQHYRHPDVPREASAAGDRPTRFDPGFQGFGAARSDRQGVVAFRTIRPVTYPGRTPHIHVKARHVSFGEWTSQLFVAGEPGNGRDFLWRHLAADERAALEMKLMQAASAAGAASSAGVAGTVGAPPLAWSARHELVLPA